MIFYIELLPLHVRVEGREVMPPVAGGEIPVEPQTLVAAKSPFDGLTVDGPFAKIGRRSPAGEDNVDALVPEVLAEGEHRFGGPRPFPVAEEVKYFHLP